uniref:Reverse transcriptase domain-containing protein n=1 Tax=Tanacetum cinerariifolium TaxID=118510 RepID=A0A6L2K886_TANCI|nr:reverse transcriptase domain-containing protein [Tanacetum cinerariifolium]
MRTRSQSRKNFPQQEASPAIVEPLRNENPFLEDQFQEDPLKDPPEVPRADDRTMAELLRAPTEGYEDAIVIPEIAANNFELKHDLINLVQNKQFFGHDNEDAHVHICYFNKITSTMRVPNVPTSSIKLMLFLFSLEGATRIWLEKEAPRSILSWDDLVSKFINQFFPPSKTTNLRNEITRFQQRFDESFYEAWERFNDLLRACPHHGFSMLHQLDTFYNALNSNSKVHQTRAKEVIAKVSTSSSTPTISSDDAELKDMVRALLLDKKNQSSAPASSSTPAPVKAVEPNYVTCGGSGTLPGNTVTNPKEDLKGITTRSGVAYQGPTIPTPSKQRTEVTKDQVQTPSSQSLPPLNGNKEKLSEMARTSMNEHCSVVILNKLPRILGDPGKFLIPCEFPGMDECLVLADLGASINLMPLSMWEGLSLLELTPTCKTLELADRSVSKPISIAKDVSVKVGVFHFPADFVVVDFEPDPRVPLILRRCFLKTGRALIDVHKGELTLRIGNKAFISNLDQTSRYSANYNQMMANKIDFIYEMYSQEVLSFSDTTTSSNPTTYDDPIVSTTSPTLTPFGDSDFLLFEEADAFLERTQICEAKTVKSSVDEPLEVELKDLPPHLEYAFLEGDNKFPVIIAKELGNEEKSALIKMLERLAGNEYYCFLDGFSRYFEIPIDPRDQEKTTFTCPYGTFAYRRMPFGLCNAPGTFQRCMLAIFHDMVEKTMEVFMDDFLVFGNSFENCLSRLDKMLQRCEDTNLSLNWEKSHFMVNEGIVLGHKISKNGIEIDKAKVDVIAKLPHPTTVKGIRSFLGHAGFYRQFIQDFSKISRPMTHHLEKNTPFIFSEDCIKAFQTLKKKLTEAPILIAPNWDLPFELMCDASDFTIGAILGQRYEKHFKPIHYASKMMNDAESNYTTTEKEMFAVEAKVLPTNDARVVCKFLKSLFTRFGSPRAIISDRGTYFFNDQFAKVMLKYGVTHRLSTAYHPQTSGQVEVLNRGLKRILERTIGENRASWSEKLDDALWTFRIAYKTPIGYTPYKLVYGKVCHLPIELEHKAYWALKQANFDLTVAGDHRKVQLNELNELRDHAYENSLIYKEKTKRIHDFKIKNCVFNVGDRVLLFNSRLKIFSGKLKTRWSGPFTIAKVFPYGMVGLFQANGPNFKVNGHRVKHYL